MKNRFLRLASGLFVLCLITTSVISGTYAKYVTGDNGNDTARVAKWGVEISRVEIQELQTSKDTADAMGMEMEAERRKRASVLDAEGSAEAKRKEADATAYKLQKEAEANAFAMQKAAEAEAYALRTRAEAEAEYIRALTEQLGKEEVSKVMMLDKVLAAYRAISSESSNKVFLPANIKTLISDMADEVR